MPKSRSTISDLSSFIESLKKQNPENTELEERVKIEKLKKFDVVQFQKLKDLPAWFRSLSNNQIAAADSLTECIRDDIEQNTTHRCRLALWRLGLYPLEPSKNLKFVINLSRGNDLAFLWFLMELFYLDTCAECDHPKTEYNVNQQILMSAIAHLDMVVTLRELDKIAPRPPKPEPKKRPRVERPKKKTYLSPLLEPLPRPKIRGSIKFIPPKGPVQQLRYSHLCNDPNYIPPNEWNRWYSWPKEIQKNLDFGFGKTQETKAVKIVLWNCLDSILKGKTEIKEKISKMEKKRQRMDNVEGKYLDPVERKKSISRKDQSLSILDGRTAMKDIQKPLCRKHLKLQEKEKERKKIEDVNKREEARKWFSPHERKRVRSRRIAKQIEQDAKRIQDERDQRLEYLELQTWIKCFVIDLIWNATTLKIVEKNCALEKACSVEKIQQNKTKKTDRCQCCLGCVDDIYDFGHYGKPKPNEIYFHAPSKNKPYNFDYPKIFKDVEETKDPIKNAISKALDLDEFADENEAIYSWLKSTWEKVVKKSNEEYERKGEQVTNERKIINPSQKEMDEILENCFMKMKKNPKFVFASMPDARKHPSVRMWLRQRFGILRISEKERAEGLLRSKNIMFAIGKQKYPIGPPTIDIIGKRREVSYACRNYVYSKTKRALDKFYHDFKILYLERCRIFWQLMEHRHCTIPPWETFYAYMPDREYDIMPFKPWKTNEFMDGAEGLRKRQVKKRMEAKYKL